MTLPAASVVRRPGPARFRQDRARRTTVPAGVRHRPRRRGERRRGPLSALPVLPRPLPRGTAREVRLMGWSMYTARFGATRPAFLPAVADPEAVTESVRAGLDWMFPMSSSPPTPPRCACP
ncbi:hypothetical protein ACR6C2_01975 [Streptomyces sp. INA 01156]